MSRKITRTIPVSYHYNIFDFTEPVAPVLVGQTCTPNKISTQKDERLVIMDALDDVNDSLKLVLDYVEEDLYSMDIETFMEHAEVVKTNR